MIYVRGGPMRSAFLTVLLTSTVGAVLSWHLNGLEAIGAGAAIGLAVAPPAVLLVLGSRFAPALVIWPFITSLSNGRRMIAVSSAKLVGYVSMLFALCISLLTFIGSVPHVFLRVNRPFDFSTVALGTLIGFLRGGAIGAACSTLLALTIAIFVRTCRPR